MFVDVVALEMDLFFLNSDWVGLGQTDSLMEKNIYRIIIINNCAIVFNWKIIHSTTTTKAKLNGGKTSGEKDSIHE